MAFQKMQSLMGAAGEALGFGDPLTTLIGSKVNQATNEDQIVEDWSLNMEICDLINSTEEGAVHAVRALKKRLQMTVGKSYKGTMFTLIVLETCVKNCGKNLHFLVCQREFSSELIELIISSKELQQDIQDKVLSMIQSWAHAFSPDPDLRGVAEVYMDLKRKGVEFPVPSDEDLLLVQTVNKESPQHRPSSSSSGSVSSMSSNRTQGSKGSVKSMQASPSHKTPIKKKSLAADEQLRPSQTSRIPSSGKLTAGQVNKIERDLEITNRNLEVFSELLTELQPGQEDPEDKKLLIEVSKTCREMQARILELIGIVKDGGLTAKLLETNDNMNNQLLRFERYKNNMKPQRQEKDPDAFSPDEVLLQLPSKPVNKKEGSSRPVSGDPSSIVKTGNEIDFEEMEAWMKEHEGEMATLESVEDVDSSAVGQTEENISDELNKFLLKRVESVKLDK